MRNGSLEQIAITGLSAKFAGASGVRSFWKNILYKRQLFSPLSLSESAYNDVEGGGIFSGSTLPKYGAFLGENYGCLGDQIQLPDDLNAGDNTDFYFISQLIHDALVDAHQNPTHPTTDRIACFMGYDPAFNPSLVNWLQHGAGIDQTMGIVQRFFPAASFEQMMLLRQEFKQALPKLLPRHIDMAHSSMLLIRLAQSFGMSDMVSITNAGEASVFAALEAGIQALQLHRCDVAIIGAVQPPLTETYLLGKAGTMAFSTQGELRPFTDMTTGTVPGEGGAFFVLRRKSDAEAAEESIYALVHGTGVVASVPEFAQEGHSSIEPLRRALHRALRKTPNGFRDVDYWEMNASGIPSEDHVEETLLARFTANRGAHIPLLALGSVKTTIGHTMMASGAAGLLKATLALHHRILPPSVTPTEGFHLKKTGSAYYWVQESRPWIASSIRTRRVAVSTVSELGYAGAAVLNASERL